MKKTLLLLFLLPLALLGAPQAITKDGGALTAPFTVPTGTSISATGTGTITATSVSGSTPSSSSAFNATGTGGGGYFQGLNQASAPSTPTTAGRMFWDSSNYASFIGTSGFGGKLNFTGNSAFRVYTFPDYAATLATLAGTETLTNKSIDASQLTGTIAAGRMPALTGDVTTSSGSVATTLATVNSNVGTFGSATKSVTLTFDAKGRATAAAEQTVTPAVGSITGLGTAVATALGVNVGTAGSVVVNGGALGTPSAGVGTNLTATKASVLNGDTLSVTYTGTPPFPLYIDLTAPAVAGITGAGTGSPVTMTAVAQKGANTINYNEGGVATPLGNFGITAITFNDLQFVVNLLAVSNMTNCTTIAFPELLWVGGSVSLAGGGTGVTTTMPSLTTVSLPKLQYAVGTFNVGGSTSLTTLSCPELLSCAAFTCQNLSAVTTFSFPKLQAVTALFAPLQFASLTTLSFPALTDVGGTSGTFSPNNFPVLTTFDFPVLKTINTNCSPSAMASLTTLSFPALQYIGGTFSPATMVACTTVSLPSMVTYGTTVGSSSNITIPSASMAAVTTVTLGTIGTLKTVNGASVTLSGLALNQASVDGVLKLLASLDGTGGTTSFGTGKTITLTGGTNASPTTSGTTATTPAGSSFVGVGTTCTATITTHGLSSGDIITTTGIATLTNANVTAATVTVLNANQFTFTIVSQTATGTGTASMHSTPAAGTDGFHACQVIRLRGATVTTALGF